MRCGRHGAAAGARALRRYLELPEPPERIRAPAASVAVALAMLAALAALWRALVWHDGIRALFDMASTAAGYAPTVGAPALCLAAALFDVALRIADGSLQAMDALAEPGEARPDDPMRTGGAASLAAWDTMGRTGRDCIASAPDPADIGPGAMRPIRVYAGLRSAPDPAARARLVLAELKRQGAFARSALVIASPTGAGWLAPGAMDTLEHLRRGDVATAAIQHSYLLSWVSLLIEPGHGAETSRALFREVCAHWTALPEDARPRLYLHGLSLGALGSQQSTGLFEVLGDPFHGAVWAGPPFTSAVWSSVTAGRAPNSPAWLPRFDDGSIVRFTSQRNAIDIPGAEWGPMRIVCLQYANDPIVFFDPAALWREPEWMKPPRGPDLSPDMRRRPVVTFLQLAVDMALATNSADGHGHVYAPEHYVDAWRAVTRPSGRTDEGIAALKARFIAARAAGG